MNFDPQTGQPIGGVQPQPMPQTPVQPVPPVAPQAPVPPVPAAAPGYGMPPQQPQQPIPQAPTPPVAPVPPQKSGSPVIFIVIGVAALLIVAGIILAVVLIGGKKDEEKGGDTGNKTTEKAKGNDKTPDTIDDILEDYEKEKKINEEIKDQYETKVYELGEEILVEFHNKTNYVVNADLQIEFYDENNTPVDIKDIYISGCPKNGVYYDGTYTDAKYASYKIKGKQELSIYTETYVPSVEIVSSNVSNENYYIVQIKNNHTKELADVVAIALFKDANGNIIAFKEYNFNDVAPGDTAMDKRAMPYGDNYKPITYDKVDVIVFTAKAKLEF